MTTSPGKPGKVYRRVPTTGSAADKTAGRQPGHCLSATNEERPVWQDAPETPEEHERMNAYRDRHFVDCDDCGQQTPRSVTEPSPTTGAPLCPDCTATRRSEEQP